MQLFQKSPELSDYLAETPVINFSHPLVKELSAKFTGVHVGTAEKVRIIYEYVRDNFSHSIDIGAGEVSITASDVIKNGHGLCYAKSHLLAALLRAQDIPAGICYQYIIFDDNENPYILPHALNAAYIEQLNHWVRFDSRGNKKRVDAQFSLEHEQLAFPIRPELGEKDIPFIYAEPDEQIISVLNASNTPMDAIKVLMQA